MSLEILRRSDLPLGGFAGLKEHRLVVDRKIGGSGKTFNGIGNFVYLADARFMPHGETMMHPHHELDVISLMVEGRIAHKGSLAHGQDVNINQVQVQRAGGEGFEHNEINPDGDENRMIQLWMLPEKLGEPADYRLYDLELGVVTHVYGGSKNQTATMDSHTFMSVGVLNAGQTFSQSGEFMTYITRGSGTLNDEEVFDGDLIRGENLNFIARGNVQLIIISHAN